MTKKRAHDDTTVPPLTVPVEDALAALLRTPPPQAGDPSTRKQQPAKPTKKRGKK